MIDTLECPGGAGDAQAWGLCVCGDLEDRLRRLVWQPSADEYLDASDRERARSLHALVKRLAPYGFDGGQLFTERSLRVIAEDTPEQRDRNRDIVEAWYMEIRGRDPAPIREMMGG